MNINPFDILKNAGKIQEQMGVFQEKLKLIKATGSSGGGLVEIDLDGQMDMIAVRISGEALEDTDMLGDLIIAAYNSAVANVKEAIQSEMSGTIAGINIPGGFPA